MAYIPAATPELRSAHNANLRALAAQGDAGAQGELARRKANRADKRSKAAPAPLTAFAHVGAPTVAPSADDAMAALLSALVAKPEPAPKAPAKAAKPKSPTTAQRLDALEAGIAAILAKLA